MGAVGIIQKVHEPTKWVNSVVTVENKLGKLKICLDPRDLSKNVQWPHCPIKTLPFISQNQTPLPHTGMSCYPESLHF